MVGNTLVEAQLLIITAMMPQNVYAVWKLRKSIDYREVVLPATIRISALPIGIAGLAFVLTWSRAGVNQLVGAIILAAIVMQFMVGIEWKTHWMLVTFGGSGILQGLSGMSGPPMVLWVHGQKYPIDRARAFLFAMYISNFVPQVLLLWWRFGNEIWVSVLVAMMSVPLVVLSATLGLQLGSRLGERWLRPLTYASLMLLAIHSLLEPWLRSYVYPWIHSLYT